MHTTVTLPLPPRELSPNARVHWAARARTTRRYREAAYLVALPSRPRRPMQVARVTARFFFRTRRRRDGEGWANLDARSQHGPTGGHVGAFHDGHAPRIRSAARRSARVADMGDGAERRQWSNGGTFDHCFIYAGPPRMAYLRPDYDSSSPESQVLLARCCSARRQIGTSSDIRRW